MESVIVWIEITVALGCIIGALLLVKTFAKQLEYRTNELEELKAQVLDWNRQLEERVTDRTQELEETHKQLQETYLEMVTSLVEAMTAKDTYLFGHSHNVAVNAKSISEEMGFTPTQIKRLQHGCELHDLGKIAVPDAILLKPGPLTDQEFEIIKLHPIWGARILGPLTFMKDITEMVHQEHERWDGKGYPQGLKGEQIRLEARIISVADALDAMVSDRPYRKRISLKEACEELKRCAGTQFDAQVVEACMKAYEKGTLLFGAHPHLQVDKASPDIPSDVAGV